MSTNYFTLLPQSVARKLVKSGASACEWAVLHAMMHHRPNENMEIGVNGNYVMSSRDIAEYVGLPSDDIARRGIKKLKDRGIIEVSRSVKRNGKRMNVYRLACDDDQGNDSSRSDDDIDWESENDVICGSIATDSVAVLPRVSVAELPHTQLSNPITTHEGKECVKVVANDQRFNSQKFVPKYPYPSCAEEVSDYVSKLAENTDNDAITYIVDDDRLIDDFYWMNENNGWVLPDGTPIRDWTKMLVSFAEKVYSDFEQSFTYR